MNTRERHASRISDRLDGLVGSVFFGGAVNGAVHTALSVPRSISRVASAGWSTTSAPIFLANSRQCASGSTAQICPAPAAFSAAIVNSPIGPAPNTATVSPA
jgi:hypothetical protein